MDKLEYHIVKVGGGILDDSEKRNVLLTNFAKLTGNKILIHGGGKLATSFAERLGIPVQMKEGRRITDDQMIDVVTMVYAGLVNKQLVAGLQKSGINALGLTGADGNLMMASKRPVKNNVDFGWVGDPLKVNSVLILNLMKDGVTPVIAPLTHNGDGHLLNTNADTMASTIAYSLVPQFHVKLTYVFELDGVLENVSDPLTLIQRINPQYFERLKKQGKIAQGMIPKLDNAFHAIEKGVSSVNIINYESLHLIEDVNFSNYTQISR